jgi:glycerol-3-phosphate dehydrogenase (NAD(P)+)
MNELAIIGAGAWGSALAIQAARAGSRVTLWVRDPATAAQIAETRVLPRLPGITLPAAVTVTATLPRTPLAVLAMPVAHLRRIAAGLPAGAFLVACKGLESGSNLFPLEILAALHPGLPAGVITGPNFAREIAAGLPAAAVVAAADPALRAGAIRLLSTPGFRLYGSADPIGAQVGGAAKNVIAIAAGAISRLGENARAALIARGLAELARLTEALGGARETASGLSGLGDLLLTATSAASRNYAFGAAIAAGQRPSDILAERRTATEGVYAAPALIARAPDLDLPICQAVADLVSERVTLDQAIARLLARPRRDAED